MKTLYLHIGLHKTGTTSIQKTLVINSEKLQKNKYHIFNERPDGSLINSGNLGYGWVNGSPKRYISGKGALIHQIELLTEKLSKINSENIIASAENFSWVFEQTQIKSLYNSLKKNFTIKVILYIRRQDKLTISHIQQASKSHTFASHHFYKSNGRALPEYDKRYDLYLNYHKKAQLWAEIFGKENLIIRIFDRKELHKNDVVLDFLNVIKYNGDDIEPNNLNTTNSIAETKIGHLLNESNLRGKLNKKIRTNVHSSGVSMPSRARAEEFYKHYIESNIALNEEFQLSSTNEDIFGNDFSSYPENDSDIWTEDLANKAILDILESFTEPQVMKNIKYLNKAAELLKSSNPIISKKLHKLSKNLSSKNTQ